MARQPAAPQCAVSPPPPYPAVLFLPAPVCLCFPPEQTHAPPSNPRPALQLLYDGSDPEAVRLLRLLRHVTLMHIHPPFASAADHAKFELYAQGASEASSRQWAGQPGNFQLMVKQG